MISRATILSHRYLWQRTGDNEHFFPGDYPARLPVAVPGPPEKGTGTGWEQEQDGEPGTKNPDRNRTGGRTGNVEPDGERETTKGSFRFFRGQRFLNKVAALTKEPANSFVK